MAIIKRKLAGRLITAIFTIAIGLALLVWITTFHPAPRQEEIVWCAENSPLLQSGQTVKVLTYNVQYFAGKNSLFWYEGGEDERASAEDISGSFERIAEIIRQEDPDLILLQEVDDGSKRSDHEDQLERLLGLISEEYCCHTSAFYWKASYVPHKKIAGAIGHKVSIISKYRIGEAVRYQLPLAPASLLKQQYSPKRAILETRLPVEGTADFVLLSTHFEVSDHGTELSKQQVAQVDERLAALTKAGNPWLIGGDFNLLPPGQYQRLETAQRSIFRPDSEIQPLFDHYGAIPSLEDIGRPSEALWFTMNLNHPSTSGADRTVDYFFYPESLRLIESHVRQDELALSASDHLPVIATFQLP